MKTTQLYRKHNGVLALRYVTMMLIRLGVILRETFMVPALSGGVIFCEN